jgi:hypothetical protein
MHPTHRVAAPLLKRIVTRTTTLEDLPSIRELAAAFILVHLPSSYGFVCSPAGAVGSAGRRRRL